MRDPMRRRLLLRGLTSVAVFVAFAAAALNAPDLHRASVAKIQESPAASAAVDLIDQVGRSGDDAVDEKLLMPFFLSLSSSRDRSGKQ